MNREEGGSAGPMIGITRRVVLGKNEDLQFQCAIDPDGGLSALNGVLDMLSLAAEREGWKAQLAEKRQALKIAEQQDGLIAKQIEKLTRERAAQFASFQVRHQARGRRADFALNEAQQRALEQYDAQIAAHRENQKNFHADRPMILWEIDCLVARIAGEAEPEAPQAAADAMHPVIGAEIDLGTEIDTAA
jgi:hypothetical protein